MSAPPDPESAQDTQTDPSTIIQTMQTLTDIEGDLADTALAVVASEPEASGSGVGSGTGSGVDSGTGTGSAPDLTSASASASASSPSRAQVDMLLSAESMENTLEQSIPPAPAPATAPAPAQSQEPDHTSSSAQMPTSEYTLPGDVIMSEPAAAAAPAIDIAPASATPSEHPPSEPIPAAAAETAPEAAHQASHDIAAIISDLSNPVMPAEVVPPAHDIPLETAAEEATSPISIEVVPPTEENIAKAMANGEDREEEAVAQGDAALSSTPPSTSLPINGSSSSALPSSDTVEPPAPHLPDQKTFNADQAIEPSVPLPEGLSGASPSVVTNKDLVRLWRQDPSNPHHVLALFNWSVQRTEVSDARAWYAVLAKDSPTAIQPLLGLINLELALSNFAQVEALFATALKGPSGGITAAADVSVWKAYLHYIRRQNPIAEGAPNAEQTRGVVTKAYEFALKECGTDRESGEVWQEYIDFINNASPKNTWEEQQQADTLRKAYQRAVCIPLNNVESLWKAYDAFESGLNKLTAKKFLAERSPAYMTARTALRELRALTDALPKPVLPPQQTFSEQDRQMVNAWKAYLKWEEGNPLVIEDPGVLAGRIGYALRKCLGEMRHFPELCILLTFALTELEEERKEVASAREHFDSLISYLSSEVDELKSTIEAEVNAARGPEISAPVGGVDDEMNGVDEAARLVEEREARGKLVLERRGREVSEVETAIGVVWVMYMRFARRSEGIKMARAVFGKARKSQHVTWHIFEASAMMEYHTNKDPAVAVRIFELGFKLFPDDVDYVIRYLQFLLSINDDTNARALFERSALKIPTDKARPLWDAWARYEYMYADLGAVQKLETRFAEVFPNDSPLKRFAQRFTYSGIDEIAIRDLGFGRAPRPAPLSASASALPASMTATSTFPPTGIPSPTIKRPAPDSPQRRRASVERSHSPSRDRDRDQGPPKRYRQQSPPRRYPDRERERERERPPPRGYGRESKERSPMPPHPPTGIHRGAPQVVPSHPPPPPPPVSQPVIPPRDQLDRSGVTKPLAWFIGSLPSARAFDGPIFRPDDIMGLFSNIDRAGVGIPGGPPAPPPGRGGYSEPDRRYGAPPPMRRY